MHSHAVTMPDEEANRLVYAVTLHEFNHGYALDDPDRVKFDKDRFGDVGYFILAGQGFRDCLRSRQ